MDLSQHPARHLWKLPIEPREVQLEALARGFDKRGYAYFLRQRLGKTWLAYANFVYLQEKGEVDWFFVICPNSLKEQWQLALREVDEFVPICVYESNNKARTEYFFENNLEGGVFIINYESLVTFLKDEGFMKLVLARTFIVADESTKLKDPKSIMTKCAHTLADQCLYRRILTGKPCANSFADFWGQLKFINATKRNFHSHKSFFTAYAGYQGRQFQENINEGILKAEMRDVSYIAPDRFLKGFKKIYEPLNRVNLTGDLLKMYKDMENSLVVELSSERNITAPIVLTKYLRLQQISSGIAGDPDGVQHNLVPPEKNPKIRVLLNILEKEVIDVASDKKVIIVCRFTKSIDNISKMLDKAGHHHVILQGGLTGGEIESRKYLFNHGHIHIMLAQLQVLSFGHTLCGNKDRPCDTMIFFESDFSLINRVQCESRPENADWDVPISYYDMYASKMDRYILESLRKKEDWSMSIMGYARSLGLRPVIEEKVVDHGLDTELERSAASQETEKETGAENTAY